jgi:hypothetical protein
MSWGAQNRSEDAKTPSAAGVRSRNPKLELCGIRPYMASANITSSLKWSIAHALRRYRRNPQGVWPPFVLRHIEGKKDAGHGATAATAADTKCAQHQPL